MSSRPVLTASKGGDRGGKAPRVYTCTVCKREGFWDDGWSHYGSLVIEENWPQDMIYSCSRKCQKVARGKIESGEWQLPKVRLGYSPKITQPRKGY